MPVPNLAEPVHTWETRGEKSDEKRAGQTDDIEEVAFDPLDETRTQALDRVPAGASLPLARADVMRQLARRQLAERHERRLGVKLLPGSGSQAKPGDDRVRPAPERLEHRLGLRFVRRLSEQLTLEQHLGVDPEHRAVVRLHRVRLP